MEKHENKYNLTALPPEILTVIFLFPEILSLVKVEQTCKMFHKILSPNELIWKLLCSREGAFVPPDLEDDNDFIKVNSWDSVVPIGSTILDVIAYCEVDSSSSPAGEIEFSYKVSGSWSSWICNQETQPATTFACDLFSQGVDTPTEINALKIRCRHSKMGNSDFSIDYIYTKVDYVL